MLTQERFEEIVRIVTRDGAATVPELARLLETSESTIRRDLVQLDSLGKVRKVHGGARGGACAGAQYAGKIQS